MISRLIIALFMVLGLGASAQAQSSYADWAGWGPTMTARNTGYTQVLPVSTPAWTGTHTVTGTYYQWSLQSCFTTPPPVPGWGVPSTTTCTNMNASNTAGLAVTLCFMHPTTGATLGCNNVTGANSGWIPAAVNGQTFSAPPKVMFTFAVNGGSGPLGFGQLNGQWNYVNMNF